MRISTVVLFAAIAAVAAGNTPVFAGSSDFFLKIEGVKGEAKDQGQKTKIDIQSFSFGNAPGTTARTASEAAKIAPASGGKPMTQPIGSGAGSLSFKAGDAQTKAICAGEKKLEKAVFGTPKETFVLHDVTVTGCAAAGAAPSEQISFNYQKIETTPARADKKPDGMMEDRMKKEAQEASEPPKE